MQQTSRLHHRRSRSRLRLSAIAATTAAAAALAALSPAAPSGAAIPNLTAAYLETSGPAFPVGKVSVPSTSLAVTGTNTALSIALTVGAGDVYTVDLAPRTGATFASGTTETATAATATASKAKLDITRSGSSCSSPQGSFVIDDVAFGGGGGAVSRLAMKFDLTCAGATSSSARGFAYLAEPQQPLGSQQLGEFTSITPVRLLDTRTTTRLTAGATTDVTVTANSSGVPTGALAVVLNLTAVNPSVDTFLSVYPTGGGRPLVSNLNPRAHDTVANLATVKVGTNDKITVYNELGTTDALVDVVGYYELDNNAVGGSRYRSTTPVRRLDTRNGGVNPFPLGAGETRTVDLLTSAGAAIVNVTAVGPTQGGYLTLFPADLSTPPLASTLNFTAGQTVANLAIVKLDVGKLNIYNPAGSTNVIVDLIGTFDLDTTNSDKTGEFAPLSPTRVYDTRNSAVVGTPTGPQLTARETRSVDLLGTHYPFEYSAIVANVTATGTDSVGYYAVYPANASLPFVSNVSWAAGETRPNLVVSKMSPTGYTNIYNAAGNAHLIIDLAGYFTT